MEWRYCAHNCSLNSQLTAWNERNKPLKLKAILYQVIWMFIQSGMYTSICPQGHSSCWPVTR